MVSNVHAGLFLAGTADIGPAAWTARLHEMGDRVSSILAFLRNGYPTCAPGVGYASLLALLPRRVSDDEVTEIAHELAVRGCSVDDADIGVEITRSIHEMPSLDDIERVRQELTAIGGPETTG